MPNQKNLPNSLVAFEIKLDRIIEKQEDHEKEINKMKNSWQAKIGIGAVFALELISMFVK